MVATRRSKKQKTSKATATTTAITTVTPTATTTPTTPTPTPTITVARQRSAKSFNHEEKKADRDLNKRLQVKKIVIHVESNSGAITDIQPYSKVDIECSKRDAREMMDYSRNTIEYEPNGAIVITPHPRQLPTAIIARIMHYIRSQRSYFLLDGRYNQTIFYQCALVNKRFNTIATQHLWHTPSLEGPTNVKTFLTCLASIQLHQKRDVGRFIRNLHLDATSWTDVELLLLLPSIRYLEKLSISMRTPITNVSLARLPQYCQHLTSLNLHGFAIEWSVLRELGEHCCQLKDLTLDYHPGLPTNTFDLLSRCALETVSIRIFEPQPKLEKKRRLFMGMHHLHQLKDLEIFDRSSDVARIFLSVFRTRQQTLAKNSDSDSNHDDDDDNDNDLWTSSRTRISTSNTYTTPWPHLRKLSRLDCSDVDDRLFIPFFTPHSQLEYLDLYETIFTDASLYVLSRSCPMLSHLTVSSNPYITHGAVRWMIRRLPRLTCAVFKTCPGVLLGHFPESSRYCIADASYQTVILEQKALDKIRSREMQQQPSL
ncbi:unnamed protein product [Absidia cylindrospora]